ncbi:MAG: gephyrin-like molybdotransferase Glp [Terriglobales bacterium]
MSPASPSAEILSFEDARHCVETHAARMRMPASETVELLQAAGRVLAEAVMADRDFPPFRRATRDGYALRAADLDPLPAVLKVIGEIKAGNSFALTLAAGQAVAIMTGAPAPTGSDAVVMVEYTSLRGDTVEIIQAVKAGDNIVPVGSEAKRGARLVSEGARIDHAVIAAAASVGMTRLRVYRRPRVAVLATGDEVVDVAKTPGPSQIRNSNSYSIAAQVEAVGGEAVVLPVAPDEPRELCKLIKRGLEADLLLLSGGVSAGKYDLVEQVLEEINAEFLIRGAWIQPGKPVVFGRTATPSGEKYFFGLPGNPVSTMVTFDLFARPMIQALGGQVLRKLVFLSGRLKSAIKTKTGLKRFLPAIISGEFESAEVELAGWQGSGDIATMTRANCYIVVPPDRERIEVGEWVSVMPR